MRRIQHIDNKLMYYFLYRMKSPRMDKIMPFITKIGNGGIIWIFISCILILNAKYKDVGERVLAALVVGSVLANLLIKPVVGRIRPCTAMSIETIIKKPIDFSFPSGHSMSSFSAATMLLYVNPFLGIFALTLASLIALSRVYLGVHYPSDIAAGMLLGVFVSMIVVRY